MASLVALTGFIAIFFTAPNIKVLLVGEILAGIPWGVFQTLCITYASEVCPVALRGYLTAYVNMCWGIGQLIGVGVIKAMLGRTDEWAYRIPYGLQWSKQSFQEVIIANYSVATAAFHRCPARTRVTLVVGP